MLCQSYLYFDVAYALRMIIGILGPEGTFSEKAAKKWNDKAELEYYEDVFDVAKAVVDGVVDHGIIPIENSLEGSVGMALDALLQHEVKMIGEVIIPIRYCLLSTGSPSEVKTVLSHPQALAQCRHFLKSHLRGVEIGETASTALAAQMASKSKKMAAIASEEAADRYGLRILMRDIQDQKENYTRFAVLGKEAPGPSGKDKTSVIVYLRKDRPGALHEILGEFASRDVNLTKIESRPTKKVLGDYLFFIDLEGHIENATIKTALENVKAKAGMLKVLGSYPVAVE